MGPSHQLSPRGASAGAGHVTTAFSPTILPVTANMGLDGPIRRRSIGIGEVSGNKHSATDYNPTAEHPSSISNVIPMLEGITSAGGRERHASR
jgi:hypothetical protein